MAVDTDKPKVERDPEDAVSSRLEKARSIAEEQDITVQEALVQLGATVDPGIVERAKERKVEREAKQARPPEPPREEEPVLTSKEPTMLRLPETAKVLERDAKGNPTVYDVKGVRTYAPGSTIYELGFRNEKEYRKAQSRGAGLGPHPGRKVPENSVVLLEGGKPVARYSAQKFRDKPPDVDFKNIRVAVKGAHGKEVYLTNKQIDRLNQADTPTEKLKVAKELKLVSKATTLKQFTTTGKDVAAARFVSQQEQKRQAGFERKHTKLPDGYIANTDLTEIKKTDTSLYNLLINHGFSRYNAEITARNREIDKRQGAIDRLNKYPVMVTLYDKEGNPYTRPSKAGQIDLVKAYDAGFSRDIKLLYGDKGIKQIKEQKTFFASLNPDKDGFINGVEHLRNNPKTGTKDLEKAGFNDRDIQEWQRISTSPIFLSSLFNAAVRVERNKIEKTVKAELLESPADYNARVDGLAQVKAYEQFSKSEQAAIIRERFIQAEVIGGTITGIAVGGVPGVVIIGTTMAGETAVHWNHLSTPERLVEVSVDIAMVSLMMWGGRVLRPVLKSVLGGGSKVISQTASGIAKVERIAANAGKVSNRLSKTLNNYAKTAEKIAQNTKTIKMAAIDAKKLTTEAAKAKARTEQIMATANLKTNMAKLAVEANATKVAEVAARKADELFLAKLAKLKALTPKDLAKLENLSGIKNLKSAIEGVSISTKELEVAWRFAKKAKLYTIPKNPAQIEANTRHLFRMAEVRDAQYNLQLALQNANSVLRPRYSKPGVPKGLDILESRFGVKMGWREMPPDFQPGGITRTLRGNLQRTFEQLKIMRAERVITEEEYQLYLKYLKAKARFPRSRLVVKGKPASDNDILKALDDVLDKKGKPSDPAVYKRLEKLAAESRAKYEAGLEADLKAARTAVADRKKLAEELRRAAKAKPQQEGIPAMITRQMEADLKARGFTQAEINKMTPLEAWGHLGKLGRAAKPIPRPDIPKVKPAGLTPVPFGLPRKKKEVEVPLKEETHQEKMERLYGHEPTEALDAYSKSITKVISNTKNFEKLTPAEWTQVKAQIKAGIEAKTTAEVANLTRTKINEQIQQAVQQKADVVVKQQPQTKPQVDIRAAAVTKVITKTSIKPVTPVKPIKPVTPKIPILIPLPGSKADKKNRETIRSAKGAVAWRQGELHGKDRWDVIMSPYTGEEDYMIVLGRKPDGAILKKGPRSAFKTAQTIYGHRLERPTVVNQPGLFSTKLTPTGTEKIGLEFTTDARLSERIGSLEGKGRVFPLP